MNKYAYIAALVAVPALVSPGHADEEITAGQIVAYKVMVLMTFVEVMEDESTTWVEKAAKVAELADILTQLNLLICTVEPADVEAAINALLETHGEELMDLMSDVKNIINLCRANRYYGCPALRTAIKGFEEAFM